MKDLETVMPNAISNAADNRNVDKFAEVHSSQLTLTQKEAIKYFYGRLSRIYMAEYRRQLPDAAAERASKSEFGGLIMDIPIETMRAGFNALHADRGRLDSKFEFMNMDLIIATIRNGGRPTGGRAGIYDDDPTDYMIERKRQASESQEAKNRCKQAANSALAEMMDGLGSKEPEPPLEMTQCEYCSAQFEAILTICPVCKKPNDSGVLDESS